MYLHNIWYYLYCYYYIKWVKRKTTLSNIVNCASGRQTHAWSSLLSRSKRASRATWSRHVQTTLATQIVPTQVVWYLHEDIRWSCTDFAPQPKSHVTETFIESAHFHRMFNRFILNRAQFITYNTIKEPLKCVSGNFSRRQQILRSSWVLKKIHVVRQLQLCIITVSLCYSSFSRYLSNYRAFLRSLRYFERF